MLNGPHKIAACRFKRLAVGQSMPMARISMQCVEMLKLHCWLVEMILAKLNCFCIQQRSQKWVQFFLWLFGALMQLWLANKLIFLLSFDSITESITYVWRSQQSCNSRKIHARRHTSHINRWQRHKCYAMDCFINFLWNQNQFFSLKFFRLEKDHSHSQQQQQHIHTT